MHIEVKKGVGIIMVVLGTLACGHSGMQNQYNKINIIGRCILL